MLFGICIHTDWTAKERSFKCNSTCTHTNTKERLILEKFALGVHLVYFSLSVHFWHAYCLVHSSSLPRLFTMNYKHFGITTCHTDGHLASLFKCVSCQYENLLYYCFDLSWLKKWHWNRFSICCLTFLHDYYNNCSMSNNCKEIA